MIGVAWAFAALLPARGFIDQETNDLRVDVVVDMTDAGKKIARPTPDNPAYYLPLTVGYKEVGAYVPDQKPPPPKIEVEDLLNKALSLQGYRVMTKESRPSLVLVFWWGHMAPEIISTEAGAPESHTNSFNAGNVGDGAAFDSSDPRKLIAGFSTVASANESEMVSLVAGNARDYQYATDKPNPVLQQILTMEKAPRHYLIVSAFDFRDWLHHRSTLLWQAHVSTELSGVSLDKALPRLIATAAPLFGRETTAPRLIGVPMVPTGHVHLGAPVVKGFPAVNVPPVPGENP